MRDSIDRRDPAVTSARRRDLVAGLSFSIAPYAMGYLRGVGSLASTAAATRIVRGARAATWIVRGARASIARARRLASGYQSARRIGSAARTAARPGSRRSPTGGIARGGGHDRGDSQGREIALGRLSRPLSQPPSAPRVFFSP